MKLAFGLVSRSGEAPGFDFLAAAMFFLAAKASRLGCCSSLQCLRVAGKSFRIFFYFMQVEEPMHEKSLCLRTGAVTLDTLVKSL